MTFRIKFSWSEFRKMMQCYIMPVILIVAFSSCNKLPLETVTEVKVASFEGEWFEIASYPTSFNKNCKCSKYDLQLADDGTYFKMIFSCIKKNKQGAFLAKAFFVKGSGNARWRVQHFWPFRSDYYIITLDDNYTHALIGNPDKDLLIVLSRNHELDNDIYKALLENASLVGFDTSKLELIAQTCE